MKTNFIQKLLSLSDNAHRATAAQPRLETFALLGLGLIPGLVSGTRADDFSHESAPITVISDDAPFDWSYRHNNRIH